MAAISVLVATQDPAGALAGLVRSVDAQSLPAAEFELVVVDASTDGSAERLEQLGASRPNVIVLPADGAAALGDRLALGLERVTGEYVLLLDQQQRLAPRALELLLGRARAADADVVLARATSAGRSGVLALPADADGLDALGLDLAGCAVAVRRGLLGRGDDPAAGLLDPASLVRSAAAVSAVSTSAVVIDAGGAQPPTPEDERVTLAPPTAVWQDGRLALDVVVHAPGVGTDDVRAWLVATEGLAEVQVPATIAAGAADSAAGLAVTARLDPGAADSGRPLADGLWTLSLRMVLAGRELTVPLGATATRGAVIDGRPAVLRRAGRGLQLDVGATESAVTGSVAASGTAVAETAHGTLVTLELPDLHVHGDAALDARLLLGRFALPVRLISAGGRARIEGYASSLAGVSPVSIAVGDGVAARTGLELRIDGTGGMVFAPVPPPAPKTPAPVASGPTPLAQRLRRRLPDGLEPVVRRLVRVPVLRTAYRRLIGR